MAGVAPQSEYERDVISWVTSQANESRSFLEKQFGYSDIDKTIEYIQGKQNSNPKPSKLSNFMLNHLGKITGDTVSALTDIKPLFSYRTNNKGMADQAMILNKLATAWWLNNFIDLKLAATIQLAIPTGCAYMQIVFNPDLHGGLGDIDIIPRDARNILPIRPANSISIQDCMGVIVYSLDTLYNLRRQYPDRADKLVADSDFSFNTQRTSVVSSLYDKVMSPVHHALRGKKGPKGAMKIPGKEIFTVYLNDDAVNETNSVVKMGYGSNGEEYSWSYTVEPDEPLYPRGRVIVCGKDIVLYDGPNVYWHGMFPLVKVPMDMSFVYEDSFLSRSPLHDVIPAQDMINSICNGIIDGVNKALAPDVIGDKRAVSRAVMDKINTREPGLRILTNPVYGDGIKYSDPPVIPNYVPDFLKFLIERMEYITGSVDMANLARVRQLPAAETVEAIMQAMTPMNRMRGRIMEAALRELAEMLKYNFLQFYDVKRRVSVLGPGGVVFEDFDFDPGQLVPDGEGDRYKRAVKHASNFSFYITPNSMLEMALVSKKVLYLQLRRMGEIDHQSFLEMMEIPNIPEIDNRLSSEIDQKIQLARQLQEGSVGRPPSGQQLPKLEQKGDGRPVVSESP